LGYGAARVRRDDNHWTAFGAANPALTIIAESPRVAAILAAKRLARRRADARAKALI
jgi:hypothetical protein